MPIVTIYYTGEGRLLDILSNYAKCSKLLNEGAFDKTGVPNFGQIYVTSTEPFTPGNTATNFTGDPDYEGFVAQASPWKGLYGDFHSMQFQGTLGKIVIGNGIEVQHDYFRVKHLKLLFDFESVTADGTGSLGDTLINCFRKPKGLDENDSAFSALYNYLDKSGTYQIGSPKDDGLYSFATDDTFKGNGGQDTFVFRGMDTGRDTILDFDPDNLSLGHDKMEFSTDIVVDYDHLSRVMWKDGHDTVIKLDHDNSVTLRNVSPSELDPGDFLFSWRH